MHRPQTRRRKENSLDCLEKMKQLRDNILAALEMTEMVVFRESRKRDIHVSRHMGSRQLKRIPGTL